MKVKNMQSNKGNTIANQFIIEGNDGLYFQSYNSIIAKIPYGRPTEHIINPDNKTILDKKYWNYSRTTSKYRNIFLNESTKETEKRIENGEYILTNLN
jgi:hypothetical protein